jgi:hypothetical protein
MSTGYIEEGVRARVMDTGTGLAILSAAAIIVTAILKMPLPRRANGDKAGYSGVERRTASEIRLTALEAALKALSSKLDEVAEAVAYIRGALRASKDNTKDK